MKLIILVIGLTVNGCVESFLWKKITRQLLRNIPLAANVEHRDYWKIEYVDLLREVEHEQHNLDRITRFVRSRSTGLEALKFVIPVGVSYDATRAGSHQVLQSACQVGGS